MTRWSLGSRRRLVVLVALSLVLCIAAPDRRASADPDHTEAAASSDEAVATDPMSPENLAATLGADWYKSTDVAITATMDESGYHLLVGRGSEGFAWRDLATIQPGAIGEVAWTGYHCITGSGRFVVAVVAPSTAANRPVLRDIGAFAYVVSVDTGDVRNLAGAVSLKYHNPGCGIDDTAVVTRSLGRDQASTELLVADLKKASITRSFEVPDQLTSAVPVAKRRTDSPYGSGQRSKTTRRAKAAVTTAVTASAARTAAQARRVRHGGRLHTARPV